MDKKDLKFYVAPVVESVEMETENQILAGSPGDGGAENVSGEGMGEDEE